MGNEININLYAVEGISHINFMIFSVVFLFFVVVFSNDNDKRV